MSGIFMAASAFVILSVGCAFLYPWAIAFYEMCHDDALKIVVIFGVFVFFLCTALILLLVNKRKEMEVEV